MHIDDTSLTHCESHFVVQQYESWPQIVAARESQLLVSFVPVEQSECAHVPPPQDWLQTELTSPTQIESHDVLQQ